MNTGRSSNATFIQQGTSGENSESGDWHILTNILTKRSVPDGSFHIYQYNAQRCLSMLTYSTPQGLKHRLGAEEVKALAHQTTQLGLNPNAALGGAQATAVLALQSAQELENLIPGATDQLLASLARFNQAEPR
jgi:hypothetical protein